MARLEAKYNPELEKELRTWIEAKTGEKLDGTASTTLGRANTDVTFSVTDIAEH